MRIRFKNRPKGAVQHQLPSWTAPVPCHTSLVPNTRRRRPRDRTGSSPFPSPRASSSGSQSSPAPRYLEVRVLSLPVLGLGWQRGGRRARTRSITHLPSRPAEGARRRISLGSVGNRLRKGQLPPPEAQPSPLDKNIYLFNIYYIFIYYIFIYYILYSYTLEIILLEYIIYIL